MTPGLVPRLPLSGRTTFFGAQAVEIAEVGSRKTGVAQFLDPGGLTAFGADLFQFTGIEPIPATVGALVDLHPPFGAEIMAMQLNSRASRTIPLARGVDHNLLIPADVQQRLSG